MLTIYCVLSVLLIPVVSRMFYHDVALWGPPGEDDKKIIALCVVVFCPLWPMYIGVLGVVWLFFQFVRVCNPLFFPRD